MALFRVKTSLLCTCTWEYEIEAPTADEALEAYYLSDHGEPIAPVTIGDCVGNSWEEVALAPSLPAEGAST